jgi:HupE/UreJ protein
MAAEIGSGTRRALVALIVVAGLAAAMQVRPAAHDIASDVTIQAFVRPEGQRLRILLRVPMPALRDIDYPRRNGDMLDLSRADQALNDAATLWVADNLTVYENDAPLPYPRVASVRASLPSDPSFGSYESALAHVTGPRLPADTEFVWKQGVLDALFEYPITSDRSRFSLEPRLARLGLRVVTVLRFITPDGTVRAFEYAGDPGLVRLDPRWHQAAGRFVALGFSHILDGIDHLLFLFCLVIPFRRMRALVAIVTSFTVAHSITLIASAYNLGPSALWFPPLIETLIAASIVYMALENIVLYAGGAPPSPAQLGRPRSPQRQARVGAQLKRRWLITFGFGLVHGFGFSFALKQTLQFAGSHLLTSLLSFNIGVELGQILVLAILVPALSLLFRHVVAERMGTIVLSGLVAHTGWHWMTERADRLRQFTFTMPVFDALFFVALFRWLIAIVAVAAAAWLIFGVLRRPRTWPAKPPHAEERT